MYFKINISTVDSYSTFFKKIIVEFCSDETSLENSEKNFGMNPIEEC